MKLALSCWCHTDVGLRRERNEDSYLVDEDLGLFIVADGMGGHRAGEVASKLAVETVREVLFKAAQDKRRAASPRMLIAEAYSTASGRIFETSQKSQEEMQGMGTTLVSAYRYGDSLFVANVGDSRCYLYSDGNLWQLTEDHSLVNELLRSGQISETDVPKFVAKNVITRSVGFEKEVQPDILERPMVPGEFYLLCSDGLSGLVTDKDLTELFRRHNRSPELLVNTFIEAAKLNGGDDNVTVMIIGVRGLEN